MIVIEILVFVPRHTIEATVYGIRRVKIDESIVVWMKHVIEILASEFYISEVDRFQ